MRIHNTKLTSFQVIIGGFALLILTGAVLLTLPISSRSGQFTPFSDALFTSTSAVCVTGLIVHDTATWWSWFGQFVIIVRIQMGGLGIVMVATSLSLLSGRKISLMQRSTMQDAISAPHLGGIVRLAKFILKTVLIIELLGAFAMSFVFIPQFGFAQGIWYSLFHSISAFCNAGFDLMGVITPYSSLTSYVSNPVINLTIMSLIVIGGLSFMTWADIAEHGLKIRRYSVQSKVILSATALLIILPAVWFFFMEYADMPLGTRILASLFQSVTPRTAGFNTTDLTRLSESGRFLHVVLMLIGGAPGSTAGGMKITTFTVMILTAFSIFRHHAGTECFGRRISIETVRNAGTVFLMYIVLCVIGGCVISSIEGIDLLSCFYESASAIGTVGLTLGLTPSLGMVSRLILIVLMYTGRVGGLSLIYAIFPHARESGGTLLEENVVIG